MISRLPALRRQRLADLFERGHRLQQRVLVVLADGLGLADRQVLAPGVLVLAQLEVEDVGAQVAQLGGVGRVGEVRQIKVVRLGGARVAVAVDDLAGLLVLLRLAVHRLGQVADQRLGDRAGVGDGVGAVLVGGGPGAARPVVAGQLAHLGDGALGVAHQLIAFDDLAGVVGRVAGVRVQLDQQPVGFDGALVAGLVEDGVGQLLQHLARVLLAADLGQELERVAGGLGVVLGEELDQVLQRLALKLLGALLLGVGAAGLLLGQVQHVLEPQRALGRVAQLPVAPGGLEQRQVVERRLRVLQDLFVGFQRRRVALLLVEPILGDRHPRVGDVSRAREPIEDDLEVLDRLAQLALVAQRERVEVDDGVDLAELRVLGDQLPVRRLGLRQLDRGRAVRHARAGRAVRVAGRHRGLVDAHLLEIDRL